MSETNRMRETSRTIDNDRLNDALGDRLQRDAAEWGGEPSTACAERVRAIAARAPSPARWWRRVPVSAAAAAIVTVGALLWWSRGFDATPAVPPQPRPNVVQVDWLSPAIGSLERELDAVTSDARAVADVVWQGVPSRLRRLFD